MAMVKKLIILMIMILLVGSVVAVNDFDIPVIQRANKNANVIDDSNKNTADNTNQGPAKTDASSTQQPASTTNPKSKTNSNWLSEAWNWGKDKIDVASDYWLNKEKTPPPEADTATRYYDPATGKIYKIGSPTGSGNTYNTIEYSQKQETVTQQKVMTQQKLDGMIKLPNEPTKGSKWQAGDDTLTFTGTNVGNDGRRTYVFKNKEGNPQIFRKEDLDKNLLHPIKETAITVASSTGDAKDDAEDAAATEPEDDNGVKPLERVGNTIPTKPGTKPQSAQAPTQGDWILTLKKDDVKTITDSTGKVWTVKAISADGKYKLIDPGDGTELIKIESGQIGKKIGAGIKYKIKSRVTQTDSSTTKPTGQTETKNKPVLTATAKAIEKYKGDPQSLDTELAGIEVDLTAKIFLLEKQIAADKAAGKDVKTTKKLLAKQKSELRKLKSTQEKTFENFDRQLATQGLTLDQIKDKKSDFFKARIAAIQAKKDEFLAGKQGLIASNMLTEEEFDKAIQLLDYKIAQEEALRKKSSKRDQSYQQMLGDYLTAYSEYQGLGQFSTLFIGKDEMDKRMRDAEEQFCDTVLLGGIKCLTSKICKANLEASVPGGAMIIKDLSGKPRGAIHVEGEKSEPVTWVYEGKPRTQEILYKISYFIQNPMDKPITYDLKVDGKRMFAEPKVLNPGESTNQRRAGMIVKYSKHDYKEICITVKPGLPNMDGVTRDTICNQFSAIKLSEYEVQTTTEEGGTQADFANF